MSNKIKVYTTIVADPPWETPGGGRINPHKPDAKGRFPSMSVQDIKGLSARVLPTPGHCITSHRIADNSHLYLWFASGYEEASFDIARAWGFRPVSINPWVKGRIKSRESGDDCDVPTFIHHIGSGRYFRRSHEHYLFAVRGSLMTVNGSREPSALVAPRPSGSDNDWGRKPDLFYQMVERQSPGPYLELFARSHRKGWDAWGNQLP